MKTSMRNLLLNLAAIGLLALFLVWAETNLDGYKVQILNLIAVNAILALSLNLIYGFTGMFSLGHAGFMAIGAYVSALCVLPAAQKEMMWILEDIIWPFSVIHTPFWFSVVAGGFVAAIFGLFIAIPVLRLGGDYLGIATLGFAEIIRVLIVNLTPITNGSLGIKGIPFHASLLVNYGWLLITLYCMVKLLGSNFGNIFKAIRDDEIAAKVMGIDTFRTKVLSFCLGAFFAGVGGALLTTTCAIPIAWLGVRYPRPLFRLLEGCNYITSSLPGIVTALALVTVTIHYARPVYQTEVTLFLAYLLMFMPRALINLRAGIAQAPVELENVARSLGRSPARALWSITMRLAAPGAAAGAALVFLGVSNELTATLLLSPLGTRTLSTGFWALTSEIDYVAAAPYALLMIVISLPLTAVLYMQSKKMAGL